MAMSNPLLTSDQLVEKVIGMLGRYLRSPKVVGRERRDDIHGPNEVVWITAGGFKANFQVNAYIEADLTGDLPRTIALLAANMQGKSMEEIGAAEHFDRMAEKEDARYEATRDAGHREVFEDGAFPHQLPPDLAKDVGAGPVEIRSDDTRDDTEESGDGGGRGDRKPKSSPRKRRASKRASDKASD